MIIIKTSRSKPCSFKRATSIKSITLLELLIGLVIVSIIVLSFSSFETYTHSRVIFSDRRAKVQNDLNYALEHMSKYISQSNGTGADPGIKVIGSVFNVRVDFNSPHTPSDSSDDAWISYTLAGNPLKLTASCSSSNNSCPSLFPEDLSSRIISGFSNTLMPEPPVNGFYVKVDPDSSGMSNVVEIGLAGRYDISSSGSISNPQVGMKTRLICNSCSTN